MSTYPSFAYGKKNASFWPSIPQALDVLWAPARCQLSDLSGFACGGGASNGVEALVLHPIVFFLTAQKSKAHLQYEVGNTACLEFVLSQTNPDLSQTQCASRKEHCVDQRLWQVSYLHSPGPPKNIHS